MTNKWMKLKELKNENISKELNPIYLHANCKDCPSDWFFPPESKGRLSVKPGSNLYNAFATCNDCKVKTECFNFAKEHSCVGVWGGTLFTYAGISKTKVEIKQK